jgi:uncharacterized RDD family membrane protein YckC
VNDTASTVAVEAASWPRRILALVVDWFACTLVVIALIGPRAWSDDPLSGFYVLALFVAESALFTAVAGGSFGKLATRIRVVRNDGTYGPVSLLRCVLRQVLVALVVPPLVFRPDGRGLHDMAAGSRTALVAGLRAI